MRRYAIWAVIITACVFLLLPLLAHADRVVGSSLGSATGILDLWTVVREVLLWLRDTSGASDQVIREIGLSWFRAAVGFAILLVVASAMAFASLPENKK